MADSPVVVGGGKDHIILGRGDDLFTLRDELDEYSPGQRGIELSDDPPFVVSRDEDDLAESL